MGEGVASSPTTHYHLLQQEPPTERETAIMGDRSNTFIQQEQGHIMNTEVTTIEESLTEAYRAIYDVKAASKGVTQFQAYEILSRLAVLMSDLNIAIPHFDKSAFLLTGEEVIAYQAWLDETAPDAECDICGCSGVHDHNEQRMTS